MVAGLVQLLSVNVILDIVLMGGSFVKVSKEFYLRFRPLAHCFNSYSKLPSTKCGSSSLSYYTSSSQWIHYTVC